MLPSVAAFKISFVYETCFWHSHVVYGVGDMAVSPTARFNGLKNQRLKPITVRTLKRPVWFPITDHAVNDVAMPGKDR